MDVQLAIVLICLLLALVFMGLRFWRIWQRKACCGCKANGPDAGDAVCAACIQAGKLGDLRGKKQGL